MDVLVIPKQMGDAWIHAYEHQPVATPPPGPPLLDVVAPVATAVPGQPPALFQQTVRAPKGLYYVVFDNTATAGRTRPGEAKLDDRAAHISYAVQLGDAP